MCFTPPKPQAPTLIRESPAPDPFTTDILGPGEAGLEDGEIAPMSADLYASILSRLRVPLGNPAPQTPAGPGASPTGLGIGKLNQ